MGTEELVVPAQSLKRWKDQPLPVSFENRPRERAQNSSFARSIATVGLRNLYKAEKDGPCPFRIANPKAEASSGPLVMCGRSDLRHRREVSGYMLFTFL